MSDALKIAFLDRDGTLILEPTDEQVDSLDKVALVPGVIAALLAMKQAGYEFVMVSNQDGLGTSSFPEADFKRVQDFVLQLLDSQNIGFREVFICPHRPRDACSCRKPKTGLLDEFFAENNIDRQSSVVIGDRETDLELARNLGLTGIRLDPENRGDWAAICPPANCTGAPRQR